MMQKVQEKLRNIWLTEIYEVMAQKDYIRILAMNNLKGRWIHVAKKQTQNLW